MTEPAVVIRPIADDTTRAAAEFLHERLNPRVSADDWERLLRPPWGVQGPDRGVSLVTEDGDIVGVYAAVYSRRTGPVGPVDVCNLAAFCVLEPYRAHGLRLVRALLKRREYTFTDFSPSGNVVAMNERLGFSGLDSSTRLVVNPPALPRRGLRLTSDPDELSARLEGADADVFRDHRDAAAAGHLLVTEGAHYAYLVYRRDRRKRLPLFASPLYAGGDRELLRARWRHVRAHLLRRGMPFTLAERRLLGFAEGLGRELSHPRPKMVRGDGLDRDHVDYLYSELALVSW